VSALAGSDSWTLTSMRRGLAGARATTGVEYPSVANEDQLGIEFTIEEPDVGAYAVGDFFYVGPTYNDEQAVIQTYFRDAIARILPSAVSGSETIPDTLATDNTVPTS